MEATEKTITERAREFVKRRKDAIEDDIADLKVSRSFASGFGFTEEDRELRGNARAEITANVMTPWRNAIVSSYTANPFGVSARRYDGMDASGVNKTLGYECEKSDIVDVATRALEDLVDDGYAYVLIDTGYDNPQTKTQYSKPVLLDNSRVFFDECIDPTGGDAPMVVYLDPILKDTAESRYGLSKLKMKSLADPFQELAYFGKYPGNYTTVATVYELTADGVQISTLVHGMEIGKPRLIPGLSRQPIVRFVGRRVWKQSKEIHVWRGAYWDVFDLLRTINFDMSLYAERIATEPTTKFLAPKGAFAGQSAQLSDINKTPKLYVEYNEFDETGRQISRPDVFPSNKNHGDLLESVSLIKQMVQEILGTPNAEAPANETAEAVLLKRSNQEATISRFLKNLKEGLEEVGRVMLEMMPSLFAMDRQTTSGLLSAIQSTSEYFIVCDNGPIAQSQKQRANAQLLAIGKLIREDPSSPVLPIIVKNLEIPDEDKAAIAAAMQGGNVAQAMQQLQATTMQNQQLQQAFAESQKTVAALQQALFEMQNDSRSKILIAQMESENKLQLKQMELANSSAELQAQIIADAQAQTRKLQAELGKEIIKERQNAPVAPMFTTSKFTG